MVSKMDNIWCYYMLKKCNVWGNNVQNGTIKTFCGNIKVTKTDIIWCYYM
jgi:hypothetical protein